MSNFRDTLDELFVTKLNYEFVGDELPKPSIDGRENIISISKEYAATGVDVVVVECKDRITEFQKKVIKHHKVLFPNAHFMFISNQGKVFDLYNNSSSKKFKPITYDEIGRNTRLFKEKIQFFDVETAEGAADLRIKIDKAFEANDKITRKFYDKFKAIHDKLQKAISGIDDKGDKSWYASVLLNRLMFMYFLQKHNAIQNDTNFLLNKFDEVTNRNEDFYQDFLLPLFFVGFAKRDNHPEKQNFTAKYGYIKYLNGGLFYPHSIEVKYAKIKLYSAQNDKVFADAVEPNIQVDATVLKEILIFLNGYTWYLQTGRSRNENEIDPDVLGYIFEKYINQKELGAYYTKEDITGYISRNCIVPYIIDKLKPLTPEGGFSLDANALITQNADIEQVFLDYLESINDYETFKFLYKDVLLNLSVLDPSVGSGAFLFAALNVLLPIYQKVVFKLRSFNNLAPPSGRSDGSAGGGADVWLQDLCQTLDAHSEEYYLTKQIILNNLYGVDIVEEATEICKLRLFLQLVSHLHNVNDIEPLPDIDFNIYAGNSLVGGLSWDDLQGNYGMKLFTKEGNAINIDGIKASIQNLTKLKKQYRSQQQALSNHNAEDELKALKDQIIRTENTVNASIDIGVPNPFHWFIEYADIFERGGFDVIIGNPPYVEYSKVKKEYELKGYRTEKCGNLYANFIEKFFKITKNNAWIGIIIPTSSISTDRMTPLQNLLKSNSNKLYLSHFSGDAHPAVLFNGVNLRASIILFQTGKEGKKDIYSTKYLKWYSKEREELFSQIKYTRINDFLIDGTLPKISTDLEKSILQKIRSNKDSLSLLFKSGSERLYFYTTPIFWVKAYSFIPYFWNEKDGEKISTQIKVIGVKDIQTRNILIGLFNSTLFFWYWIIYSDIYHLTSREVNTFKLDISMLDEDLKNKISIAVDKLMNDYKSRSIRRTVQYKTTGKVIYDEINPKKSKSIIDEIDRLLGKHYGFTAEETAFIINYDLRFRMGSEGESEEE
jgi:hypothetical protein